VVVLCCMLLMPLADWSLPASLVPAQAPAIVLPVQTFVVVPAVAATQFPSSFGNSIPEPHTRDWWQIAVFVWMAVAGAFLLRSALAFIAIARIKRNGSDVSQELGLEWPAIRESSQVMIPLTIGLLRPVLVLPTDWRDWDAWKLRAVLTHELAHVRRRDWMITLTATLARGVFWFNPLSWWIERHLASLAEQASDEACIQATDDAPRYAETLLQFASVAKRGRRWIGGVSMAQYKISSRIERVLRLRNAGSGVLPPAGWICVCVFALPALYVSAATQSLTSTQLPTLSPTEMVRFAPEASPLVQGPVALAPQQQQPVVPAPQAAQPSSPPAAEVLTPTARAGIFRYWSAWITPQPQAQAPAPAAPVAPAPVAQTPTGTAVPINPDLVGEIRLILAPVDQARQNNNAPDVVWRIRNGALSPNLWAGNANWANWAFAMTGIQGRTAFFETRQGGTFSYGCVDCSFLASDTGVRGGTGSSEPGIVLRLSTEGKFVAATCRAAECRVGLPSETRTLKNAETTEFAVPPMTPVNFNSSTPVLNCFSVFGNVKADGTPFTAADCPGGRSISPVNPVFFSVTP